MAAFSFQYQQHHPFHFDSLLSPNTPIKNQHSVDDNNSVMNSDYVSQFYPLLETTAADLDVRFCNSTSPSFDGSSAVAAFSENEPSSVSKKQSTDSSTVVDKFERGEQVTRKLRDTKRRSSVNSAQSKRQKKCSSGLKEEEEKKKEEGPTAYIHVRARRGQATDSHSLAERVRREKISERMKILQRLVPGCDKVTGKALMLDEIINYVQSLQNQVEFLSMKLASLNPLLYDFGTDLDAFMFRQEGLSSLSSSLPHMQQCNPPTAFTDATTTAIATFPVANNYPLADTSCIQDPAGCLLWEVGEQRQKPLASSGFTNNLCTSFH